MPFALQPYGLPAMLKEGYKHLSGLEEAVIKNIDACKELSLITRTSLGPNGRNKMVINHLDKLFVTNDAATIVTELEVQHPAAKLVVLAGKAQQEEIGDGANLVISLSGELLQGAEELLRLGLHPSDIIRGYTKAFSEVIELLGKLVELGSEKMDVRDKEQVIQRMVAAICSKQWGQESILCPLVADACIQVCPSNPVNFSVDNVRVVKILGGGIHDCCVIQGMVLKNDALGTIKRAVKAKIAVFGAGVDTSATETKGTVLIKSAEQLENYAKSEEAKIEALIREVADSGATVIVSGGAVGEMALHFCEHYNLDQYAVGKFAECLEMVPRMLAENAGFNATEMISSLYADHASGNMKVGVNIEDGSCKDMTTESIWDLYLTKFFAFKLVADAVCTVLRVDQIIMAKVAGGPKPNKPGGEDED